MSEFLFSLAILAIFIPSSLGWLIIIRGLILALRIRRNMRRTEQLRSWSKELNDELIARAHARGHLERKRELHAVNTAKANCEIVKMGPDGPRAA